CFFGFLCNWCRHVDANALSQFKHFHCRVGKKNPVLHVVWCACFFGDSPEKTFVDLRARRMKIECTLRKLCKLGEAACNGEFIDWVFAQVFEYTACKVAHVENGEVR